MKTGLLMILCAVLSACAGGVKLPPQCEGSIRPLNGIQVSALEANHACIIQQGVA